jgi:hypothetical protein
MTKWSVKIIAAKYKQEKLMDGFSGYCQVSFPEGP